VGAFSDALQSARRGHAPDAPKYKHQPTLQSDCAFLCPPAIDARDQR
jgi:hypothetical protein